MQTISHYKGQINISFIVPYYNLPIDMLKECVESILALNIPKENREVIIVDDGSIVSAEPMLRHMSSDIIYIRQDNQGLSGARNTGMAAARGEYIQFVDGDDRLICSEYNKCIRIMFDKHPDMVLFKAGHGSCHISGKTEKTTGTQYMLLHNLHAAAWGYLFRKKITHGLEFTPGILHEDEEFTPLLFLNAQTVISTKIKAYYYRRRKGSIVHRDDEQWNNKRLNDLEGVILRLNDDASRMSQLHKDALCRRVNQLCMDYLYQTAVLTKNIGKVRQRASVLQQHGLFPLANKHYTKAYSLFRIISRWLLSRPQTQS